MKQPTDGRVTTPAANDRPDDYTPRQTWLVALAIFTVAALTLCWPMFQGKFLAGPHSDQFMAGYSFRHFAAEYFKANGKLPLWNPYLFSGMPLHGAAQAGLLFPLNWFYLISGEYMLAFDMVSEHLAWFEDLGSEVLKQELIVE